MKNIILDENPDTIPDDEFHMDTLPADIENRRCLDWIFSPRLMNIFFQHIFSEIVKDKMADKLMETLF